MEHLRKTSLQEMSRPKVHTVSPRKGSVYQFMAEDNYFGQNSQGLQGGGGGGSKGRGDRIAPGQQQPPIFQLQSSAPKSYNHAQLQHIRFAPAPPPPPPQGQGLHFDPNQQHHSYPPFTLSPPQTQQLSNNMVNMPAITPYPIQSQQVRLPPPQRPRSPRKNSFLVAEAERSTSNSSGGGGEGAGGAGALLVVVQLVLLLLFFLFVSYDPNQADARHDSGQYYGGGGGGGGGRDLGTPQHLNNILPKLYPMFQDVHVMIFIGFGFLMTFLRKYGYSAVGYNMLIAAIAIQWSILCRGLFHREGSSITINIESLINGDFAAAAVLITFGAVLGVTNPLQLTTLCLIEVFLYALNEYIGAELFKAIDVGGSIFIHTFGAYFGLALSWTMRRSNDINSDKEGATATSDIFAMIGTVFLWIFWPSFNGALAVGDDQHRAVLNTVLSLTGSCVFSFAMSALLNHENKFNMVHVQNASLAGGVAVGSVADLMIRPFGALLIGSAAGVLSTVGYIYLTPLLSRKLGLHDTCGVHNLHGMPGVFAGLIGVIMASFASESDYGKSLYMQYPARAPVENSSDLSEFRNNDLVAIEPGLGRSASQQAMYQLMALGVTLGIALVGGAVTGLLLRIPIFGKVPQDGLFDDSKLWEVPEDPEMEVSKRPSQSGGDGGITNETFEIQKDSEF